MSVKVKTAELIGPALDWAVDWVVSGKPLDVLQKKDGSGEWAYFHEGNWFASGPRKYSTDWSQGGPLIWKYQVATIPEAHDGQIGTECSEKWYAVIYFDGGEQYTAERCDSPLIAACRAIVASKLGDEVEVPDALVSQ